MLLPLGIDVLRCFTDEFTKISMDAGARATLAGKTGQGQTYLPGGELPSNSPGQTNFVPKIAELDRKQKALEFVSNVRSKAEGPTIAALKGAGGGILIGQLLTGARLGGHSGLARLGFRGFGALGAGAGLAEHLGSKHLGESRKKATLPENTKTAGVFTPARQLSAAVQTGSFKNIVHAGATLQPPKVGQKFNFPGVPT